MVEQLPFKEMVLGSTPSGCTMKKEIIVILENIRSAEDVGPVFRSADAFGIKEVFLVGITAQLNDRFGRLNSKIAKTALGAEKSVPSRYFKTIEEAIVTAKNDDYKIFSLEISNKSEPIKKVELKEKIALVLGNEATGVSAEAQNLSEKIVEIPMQGEKESLNVSVTAGIAMFYFSN